MRATFGHGDNPVAQTTTWLTPLYVVQALGVFDLDPCAYPGWPTARRAISLPEDGLEGRWRGRVWLNPPYGSEMYVWMSRLADHGEGTALIFARTETVGFHKTVWDRADAVLFLQGRLKFHRPSGEAVNAAGAPSVLVAYGAKDAEALRQCNLPGAYINLRSNRVQMDLEELL